MKQLYTKRHIKNKLAKEQALKDIFANVFQHKKLNNPQNKFNFNVMKNKKLENRIETNSFKKLKSNLDKKIIKGCACYGVNKLHTCFCNPFVVIKSNKININPKNQKK